MILIIDRDSIPTLRFLANLVDEMAKHAPPVAAPQFEAARELLASCLDRLENPESVDPYPATLYDDANVMDVIAESAVIEDEGARSAIEDIAHTLGALLRYLASKE